MELVSLKGTSEGGRVRGKERREKKSESKREERTAGHAARQRPGGHVVAERGGRGRDGGGLPRALQPPPPRLTPSSPPPPAGRPAGIPSAGPGSGAPLLSAVNASERAAAVSVTRSRAGRAVCVQPSRSVQHPVAARGSIACLLEVRLVRQGLSESARRAPPCRPRIPSPQIPAGRKACGTTRSVRCWPAPGAPWRSLPRSPGHAAAGAAMLETRRAGAGPRRPRPSRAARRRHRRYVTQGAARLRGTLQSLEGAGPSACTVLPARRSQLESPAPSPRLANVVASLSGPSRAAGCISSVLRWARGSTPNRMSTRLSPSLPGLSGASVWCTTSIGWVNLWYPVASPAARWYKRCALC